MSALELSLKRVWMSVLLLAAVDTPAQLVKTSQLPGDEAVCGYAGAMRKLTAENVRQGLAVELLAGEAAMSVTTPLRFRVTRKPQDEAVDDLQVEHEKLMHVIGVRDDLREFFHIHPQRVAPGLWQVNHTFTNAGRYQIWSDIKHQGTVYSFAQPRLSVTGVVVPMDYEKVPQLADTKAGFHITLTPPDKLVAGVTNRFQVAIRNAEDTQVGAEFFLGALLHLVVIKDDLTVYAHGHAENHLKGDRDIFFTQVFPQPGNYKIFTQFRPMKTRLSPDEAILAEFWVKVRKPE